MKQWYIQAYRQHITTPDGQFNIGDFVEVIVQADNEDDAIGKSKKIIKREYYRVFKVWDIPEDPLHDEIHLKQYEIQSRLLKALK